MTLTPFTNALPGKEGLPPLTKSFALSTAARLPALFSPQCICIQLYRNRDLDSLTVKYGDHFRHDKCSRSRKIDPRFQLQGGAI